MKKCKACLIEKEENLFPRAKRKNGTLYYYPKCKKCSKYERQKVQKKYHLKNQDKINKRRRNFYQLNIEKEHERAKKYRAKNKDKIKEKRKIRVKKKRITNPEFKIKENMSRRIRHVFKMQNLSKNNNSIMKYLNYTMIQLKEHIQSLFEEWMTWDNQGKYIPAEWDDNDKSTWKWQLDHIIPQSDLPYTSMDDENFKKCWALENLRPLCAKQNLMLGIEIKKRKKINAL